MFWSFVRKNLKLKSLLYSSIFHYNIINLFRNLNFEHTCTFTTVVINVNYLYYIKNRSHKPKNLFQPRFINIIVVLEYLLVFQPYFNCQKKKKNMTERTWFVWFDTNGKCVQNKYVTILNMNFDFWLFKTYWKKLYFNCFYSKTICRSQNSKRSALTGSYLYPIKFFHRIYVVYLQALRY